MARGRFLSKSISTNRRLGIAGPTPALAWFLSLPHADVQGCLPGNIAELAMVCFPVGTSFFGWTHETIETLLYDLVRNQFWRLVIDDNGRSAIYIEKFMDHQKVRTDREEDSKYVFSQGVEHSAGVTPEEWRQNAGVTPRIRRENVESLHESAAQVKVQVKVQEEGEVKRARTREEQELRPPLEISGSRKQEAAMIRREVVEAFCTVHPLGKGYVVQKWDWDAIDSAAHVLTEKVANGELSAFFSRAISTLPEGKITLEKALACLNDPAIVKNGKPDPIDSGKSIADRLGVSEDELRAQYEKEATG